MIRSQVGQKGSNPLFRFFCGRRGAAVSRMLVAVGTPVFVALGSFSLWAVLQLVEELKSNTEAVNQMRVERAAASARGEAMRQTDALIAAALQKLQERMDGLTERVIRLEVRP